MGAGNSSATYYDREDKFVHDIYIILNTPS
jgi:hypothetical protein